MPLDTESTAVQLESSEAIDQLIQEARSEPEFDHSYEDAARRSTFLSGLRLARKALKLRQKLLADKLGTTQSAISHLESGRADPHLRTLQRYARATNRRFDFAMCDPATPVFNEDMAKNLWSWVEFNMLGTLLTAIATQPADQLTLDKLSKAVKFPEELVGPILYSLEKRDWVATIQGEAGGKDTYRLGDRAAYVIGVSIERSRVVGVLVNLQGAVVMLLLGTVLLDDDTRKETVVRAAVEVIDALYHGRKENGEILGVGISIAGVVTADKGIVHFAPDLHTDESNWNDVHLEDAIQEAVQRRVDRKLLVAVENDANSLAMHEYLRFRPRSAVAVLMSGAGIGIGIVSNGHIIHGEHAAAGEGGHVLVDHEGAAFCRANFPHHGCLETVASARAIVASLTDDDGSETMTLTLNEQLQNANLRVEQGDERAIQVFHEAGRKLGNFVGTTMQLLDPGRVALHGQPELTDTDRFSSAQVFQNGFQEGMDSVGRGIVAEPPPLRWAPITEETNAAAAAASAMSHFLANPTRWKPSVLADLSPTAPPDRIRPQFAQEPRPIPPLPDLQAAYEVATSAS